METGPARGRGGQMVAVETATARSLAPLSDGPIAKEVDAF